MSVNNKPHQAEAVIVVEDDGFGGKVFRFSDAWYQYFNSLDQEVNVNVVQNVTSATYTAGAGSSGDGAVIERQGKTQAGIIALLAQAMAMQSDFSKIQKELAALRAEVAGLKAVPVAPRSDSGLAAELAALKASGL